jgi:signal transduction histidine kinase
LFREPTLWERNRRPIALGALLAAIPVVAIVVFVAVMKHRRAEAGPSDPSVVLMPPPPDATVRVWTTGRDGHRVEAGQAPAETNSTWRALLHPEDAERCDAILRRAVERREPFQMEYRIREAGGEDRWMLDTGLVRFSGDAFDGYVGSTVDISAIARARAELSNLSRHLIQERERERAALAKTLQDDVSQRMVAVTLRLHAIPGAAHDAEVADIRETLSNLVADLAGAADPVYVRLEMLGLATASRGLCEELSGRYNVAIRFQEQGLPHDVPFNIALALYRVLQEVTVNAAVHSQAAEVRVSMRGSAAEIRLEVVDSGIGFNAQRTVPGTGVGLVAMRERLKLVNGDSVIVSRQGEGTRVEAWVPLPLNA